MCRLWSVNDDDGFAHPLIVVTFYTDIFQTEINKSIFFSLSEQKHVSIFCTYSLFFFESFFVPTLKGVILIEN